MSDAASHDSQSLLPHLNRLFQRHPDLKGIVTRVLDDGAADDAKLKAAIKEDLGIEVLAPINPRRRGPIRDDMPRGIDHLTPRGVRCAVPDIPLSWSASGMTRSTFSSTRRKTNRASRFAKGAACEWVVIEASRAAVKSRSRSHVCRGWIRNSHSSPSGS